METVIYKNFMVPSAHSLCDFMMGLGLGDERIFNELNKEPLFRQPTLHDIQVHRAMRDMQLARADDLARC